MTRVVIRVVDIAISLGALVLLSPLFILIAFVLRVFGGGEVLFSQERIGQSGRPFRLNKFATMVANSAEVGLGDLTLPEDERILPFGQFLRRTKLNELPQLWNVLVGDMSMIGPRPQTRAHFDLYSPRIREALNAIPPGLSGVGSIVFRHEDQLLASQQNPEQWYATVVAPFKGEIEAWYVENRTIWNYFLLMALTVAALVRYDSRLMFRLLNNLPKEPPWLYHPK